jgi:hypothetical protein
VVKVSDYAAKEAKMERSRNPFAAIVLAHLKSQATSHDVEQREAWKWRLVRGLYKRRVGPSGYHRVVPAD